jgi:cytochrome c556
MTRPFRSVSIALSSIFFLVCILAGCSMESQPVYSEDVPAAKPKGKREGGGPMGVPSNPKIREAMEKLGKSETGLTAAIGRILDAEKLDWEADDAPTKRYVELVASLVEENPTQGDKAAFQQKMEKFLSGAKALERAAAAKDLEQAKAAHGELSGSCMECHQAHRPTPPGARRGGGGPGGPPGGSGFRSQVTKVPADYPMPKEAPKPKDDAGKPAAPESSAKPSDSAPKS